MKRRSFLGYALAASAAPFVSTRLSGPAAAASAAVPIDPPKLTPEQVSAHMVALRGRKQRANPPTPEVLNALARFPNSVLMYDLAQVDENYLSFLEAKPDVEIYYAVKCAPHPRVLQRIAALGGGFDFASRVELDLALATGVKVEKCIYSNTVRPAADIRYAFAQGVRAFVADSEYEVRKLAKNAPGSLLYLRLSVDNNSAAHPLADKFGTSPENARLLLRLGKELGLTPFGTHFHVGTQCMNPQAWDGPTREAAAIFRDFAKDGIDLQFFDIGGGFPAPYANDPNPPSLQAIFDVVSAALAQELPGRSLRLAAEPGRGIAATAGVVSSRVMLRAERKSGEWLHLDAGIYQGLFEAIDNYQYKITVPGRSGPPRPFTLCGPTCDSMDTLSKGQQLPGDIDEDDMLVFQNAAAYSEACNTYFNGISPPHVHFLDEVVELR